MCAPQRNCCNGKQDTSSSRQAAKYTLLRQPGPRGQRRPPQAFRPSPHTPNRQKRIGGPALRPTAFPTETNLGSVYAARGLKRTPHSLTPRTKNAC